MPKINNKNNHSLQWEYNTWHRPICYYRKIIYEKQEYENKITYLNKINLNSFEKRKCKTKTLFLTTHVKDNAMVSKTKTNRDDVNSYFSLLLFSLILSAILLASILGMNYLQIDKQISKMYSTSELALI